MNPLLDNLAIELPSWAFGNSGTRFKVFGSPGTARTVEEKIADAAMVHRMTGLAPTASVTRESFSATVCGRLLGTLLDSPQFYLR